MYLYRSSLSNKVLTMSRTKSNEELPAKRCKYNLRSHSKSRKEQQPFTTISATELLDLNDDCLYEILDYLNVTDLCSVAQVCVRWKQLAESNFSRKYSEVNFSALFHRRIAYKKAKDILLNFGSLIMYINQHTRTVILRS